MTKILITILILTMFIWGAEALYINHSNNTAPADIKFKAKNKRNQILFDF
jgi:hypothetical protein